MGLGGWLTGWQRRKSIVADSDRQAQKIISGLDKERKKRPLSTISSKKFLLRATTNTTITLSVNSSLNLSYEWNKVVHIKHTLTHRGKSRYLHAL